MPSDFAWPSQTARRSTRADSPANRRLVAGWLFAVAFMIWVMVGIGGYTRDAGAGLSIMDWKPLAGAIPPLTDAAWNRLFALYQTIPQYKLEHTGMDLAGFKALFWPEYIHRLWGRLIGIVFFIPLIGFIATRRIERRLIPWLGLLFVLGGLQGAIGWFMVASGFFPDSTSVEPWRLTLHFLAAMFLFGAVLWTALTVRHPAPAALAGLKGLRGHAIGATAMLLITMTAGTFVSGTHAIEAYDPATGAGMGAPPPGWTGGIFATKAAILFNHQALAALTVIMVVSAAVVALRRPAAAPVRDAALAIGGLVLLQFVLGISALVSKLIDVGVAHQLNAVLLLGGCLWLLHGLRGATRRAPA